MLGFYEFHRDLHHTKAKWLGLGHVRVRRHRYNMSMDRDCEQGRHGFKHCLILCYTLLHRSAGWPAVRPPPATGSPTRWSARPS